MSTEGTSVYERMYATIDPLIELVFCAADECQIRGEYEIAIRLYKEIIEKEPNNGRAFQKVADCLDHMGNHADALVWYDKALESDPYNAEVWYNKGMTLRKIGSQEEGLMCIQKGISLAMSAPSPRYRV